ncbi:MAG: ATP-binding protein [Phycisphaeraceae bacterium]
MSMQSAEPGETPRRSRLLLRGESMVAWVGMALAVIILCAMAASAWWAVRTQRAHIQSTTVQHVEAVGGVLAASSELMLARDELSSLRQLLADAAQKHDLDQARVVLPDEQVIADAEASRITVRLMPDDWPGGSVGEAVQEIENDAVTLRLPLQVAGRGDATLEVRGTIKQPVGALWEAQAGVGLIGATAMLALLMVYRYTRSRLRSLGAIREALMAIERGETTSAALTVSDDLGAEASAWNGMLKQTDQLRHEMTAERARVSLHQHRQPRSELDAAWDAMPQGLLLIDEAMRIKYANGAASVFLRTNRKALISKDVRDVVNADSVLTVLRSWGEAGPRRRAVVETEWNQQNVGQGVLRWTIRPGRRDDAATAMIVIEDITQQRVAEEARHAFVAQATHELRTPLTNIRLYVETALEEGEEDAALRSKCLNVINSESRRLERIVTDMLSTAEIDAGSLQVKRDDVRVADVFAELQADYEAQAKEKNVKLVFNLPPKLPVIQADRDMVVLALHNLLGNALKYTPTGGSVVVNVELEADQLVVEVTDTGIGISDADQLRVFEKFYRAQDRRIREITGSGLGLALARDVMRLHGGDIDVRSEIDKGSTFTMRMPSNQAA